jgi:hypothetical protein
MAMRIQPAYAGMHHGSLTNFLGTGAIAEERHSAVLVSSYQRQNPRRAGETPWPSGQVTLAAGSSGANAALPGRAPPTRRRHRRVGAFDTIRALPGFSCRIEESRDDDPLDCFPLTLASPGLSFEWRSPRFLAEKNLDRRVLESGIALRPLVIKARIHYGEASRQPQIRGASRYETWQGA